MAICLCFNDPASNRSALLIDVKEESAYQRSCDSFNIGFEELLWKWSEGLERGAIKPDHISFSLDSGIGCVRQRTPPPPFAM
ncbi:hypothetical protein AAE026_07955 [Bradyrhizobium sp. DN5]|uniref:hypothetical protein n=1 Tax=Bradyrhizobium sp. Rc2d TaxID=1855321 RepID=UPI001FCCC830|nr:hypothetical protein [Bradyrhizobium sp. Rc2d]